MPSRLSSQRMPSMTLREFTSASGIPPQSPSMTEHAAQAKTYVLLEHANVSKRCVLRAVRGNC